MSLPDASQASQASPASPADPQGLASHASSAPLEPRLVAELLAAAHSVRSQAYAPYSGFAVGAALLDEQGRIHAGANVENAAYPQGLCAEASAIAHLVAAGGRRILALAVVAQATAPASAGESARLSLVSPCGGCRQKLREFADSDTPVLLADSGSASKIEAGARYSLEQLLPASFGPQHLGQGAEP
jgi:cytidine deaminase